MPRRVLKYELPRRSGRAHAERIVLPAGSRIVDVNHQNWRPFLWAEVDESDSSPRDDPAPMPDVHTVGIFLTGEVVPDDWQRLGTIHLHYEGRHAEVLHVYEAPR